jgi:hypothetical protein
MNYWTRKGFKYETEKDTFLSQSALMILEKVKPNQERSDSIYIIFHRIWSGCMLQGLKY